jgi:hypothetical protein
MAVDFSTLDTDWWRPHFNPSCRSRLVALEYLGSEERMSRIHQAYRQSLSETPEELVAVGEKVTIEQYDDISCELWWHHMTGAERGVRGRLGRDRGSRERSVTVVGSPGSTWQPTPATFLCWSLNRVRPFPKGHLIEIPPRYQPTLARLNANLRRSQKSTRIEGVKYPGFTLAALDDGYPYDLEVLSRLCEQVSNDLMLSEPTANLDALDTHVLMWAARCFREGVRPK